MLTKFFYTQYNVSCSILGSWLVLKSIVALDSAFCNRSMRSQFIHLLTTKEIIQHNPVFLKAAKMLQWLLFKSLKIANVVFSAETERSTLLVQYFEFFGNFVRCMQLRDKCIEMETVFLIACYCKNINILRCTDVSLSLAFYAILRNNPNIREIWVHNATCVLISLMVSLSLNKLQVLSVQDVNCTEGFPWAESAHSTSLQRVEFVATNFFLSDIKALAQNCPSTLFELCKNPHTRFIFTILPPKYA